MCLFAYGCSIVSEQLVENTLSPLNYCPSPSPGVCSDSRLLGGAAGSSNGLAQKDLCPPAAKVLMV